MPISRADYELVVKDSVDISGLKSLLATLEADSAAAERMGVSIHGAADEISATKAKISAYEHAAGKAAEEVGKLDISHREVHEAMGLLAQSAGGAIGPVAELAHFLGNPYILAAEGATLAIKMLIDAHTALREQHIKNIQLSQDFATVLRTSTQSAVLDQAGRLADLSSHYKHLEDNIDRATEAMKRFIAQNAEVRAEQEETLEVTQSLIAALIHEQEILGNFTSSEATAMTHLSENRTARQREAEHEAEQRADIQLREQRVRQSTGENTAALALIAPGSELQKRRLAAQSTLNYAKANVPSLTDDVKNAAAAATLDLPGYIQAAKNEESQYRQESFGRRATPAELEHAVNTDNQVREARAAIAQLNQTQAAITANAETQARLTQTLKEIDIEIDRQSKLADEAQARVRDLTQQNVDAERSLGRGHAHFERDQVIREETQRVQDRTALEQRINAGTATPDEITQYRAMTGTGDVGGTSLTTIVAKARQLAEQLGRQRPQDRSPAALAQLHQYFDALLGFAENQNTHVRTLAKNQQNLEARISEILAEQARINGIISQSPNVR